MDFLKFLINSNFTFEKTFIILQFTININKLDNLVLIKKELETKNT